MLQSKKRVVQVLLVIVLVLVSVSQVFASDPYVYIDGDDRDSNSVVKLEGIALVSSEQTPSLSFEGEVAGGVGFNGSTELYAQEITWEPYGMCASTECEYRFVATFSREGTNFWNGGAYITAAAEYLDGTIVTSEPYDYNISNSTPCNGASDECDFGGPGG